MRPISMSMTSFAEAIRASGTACQEIRGVFIGFVRSANRRNVKTYPFLKQMYPSLKQSRTRHVRWRASGDAGLVQNAKRTNAVHPLTSPLSQSLPFTKMRWRARERNCILAFALARASWGFRGCASRQTLCRSLHKARVSDSVDFTEGMA